MPHTVAENGCTPRIPPFHGDLPINGTHPAPKLMKRIDVSVPIKFNNGKNVSAADLQPIID